MSEKHINIVVEGALDELVMRQLLREVEGVSVQACFGKKGKQNLRERIGSYNRAAQYIPFICLVDLDDEDCPVGLINRWLPEGFGENLVFRVAVRMVEAWLLADRENFARFMGVAISKIPAYPEQEENPKRTVVNIARQSPKRNIKQNIIPPPNSTSMVGKAYVDELAKYVVQSWNLDNAASNSPSLQRAIRAIAKIGN